MDKTLFGSLQLAADVRSDRDEVAPRTLSYRPPLVGQTDIAKARQPMAIDTQPLNVYKRIFGGTVLPPGTNLAAILAQKKSVLDYMRADLARLQTLIPASEKDRLAAHAQSITQLENTLQQMYGSTSGGGTGGVCMKPTMPPNFSEVTGKQTAGGVSTSLSGVDYYLPNMPSSHPHLDLGLTQLRMIKTAFACDYVRVATFMWSAGTNWVVFPGSFQGATIAGNLQSTPHHPPSHSGDAATNGWLSQINNFYSNATAMALQEFVTQPDVDGGKLIDNTIIVYVTEVARAYDHNQQNMPRHRIRGEEHGPERRNLLEGDRRDPGHTDGRLREPALQRSLADVAAEVRRRSQDPDQRHRFGEVVSRRRGRAHVHRAPFPACFRNGIGPTGGRTLVQSRA